MRLITRSDFDGLVCGVLLRQVEQIDSVEFVHPKDVQDGKIQVTSDDIVTNLPYVPGVGLWFDHHSSEELRNELSGVDYKGRFEVAPSAARVVYNHYKAAGKGERFDRFEGMLIAVDKSDSADLSYRDVTQPSGWILLSYVMDPRTGLAYYHNYRISNRDLMMRLLEWIEEHDIEEILRMPDVKERIDRYFESQEKFRKLQQQHSRVDGNVIITDLRGIKDLPSGNRFLIYTMFPAANIQVRVFDGKKGEFTVIAVGHSIFNRTSKTDVGKLMDKYGGGGHRGAGTCQVPIADADRVMRQIVEAIKRDG